MKHLSRIIFLILSLTASHASFADWKNCKYTKTEAKEVFDVFFDYFIKVDPGTDVMLDPKCEINVLCRETAAGSEADFDANCRLLRVEGSDISKMKPTGKKYRITKTVISEKGKKPILKD